MHHDDLPVNGRAEDTAASRLLGALSSPVEKPGESRATNRSDDAELLKAMRLPQNYGASMVSERILTSIPVRRPKKQEFVRVHQAPEFRRDTMLLVYEEARETYVVAPPLWSALADHLQPYRLYTAINRDEVVFLWPIRLPDEDGRGIARSNTWWDTAHQGAEAAMTKWVSVMAVNRVNAWRVFGATAPIPDPTWPKLDFDRLALLAFKGKLIETMEHPVIKRILGQA